MTEMSHLNNGTSKVVLVDKFVVRFPPGMRHQIHKVANRCKRSMNKEILARLEHSLAHFPSVPGTSKKELLETENIDLRDIIEHESPESEIIINHRLRHKLGELSFSKRAALLKFLNTL